MAVLAFSRQSKNTVSIEVINDEGEPQAQVLINRFKQKDVEWLLKLWPVSQTQALAKLNHICIDYDTSNHESEVEEVDLTQDIIDSITAPEPVVEKAAPFVCHVHNINQLKQHGRAYSNESVEHAFRDALTQTLLEPTNTEPLIAWTDIEKLCCLDVDYHDCDIKPTYEELNEILSRVRPQPLAFHMSHGNGAKLYYLSSPAYSANELAAIAGISWLANDPRATFDLIKATRHPCYGRSNDNAEPPCKSIDEIAFLYGQSDVSAIRKVLLADVEYSDVEDWLTTKGWVFGQVLPHSSCPIQPTDDSKENVLIGEKGIFCHRCKAKGYGGSTPGFISYAQLVGTVDNRITTMVKNFCHLEHARVILSNVFKSVPLNTLTDIYRVMLKIVHGSEDPRIPMAMTAGKGFVRTRGIWVTADGGEVLDTGTDKFVRSLPGTKFVSKNEKTSGQLFTDVNKEVAYLNKGDITDSGYPDISFLRGCRIYGQFLPYRDSENIKVIIRPEFRNCVPQYLPAHKRMPSTDAWGFLEQEFRGIDRGYVKLLIAAKGASEGRLAQCPFMMVTGVSGAGKSTTVHIAAGICGDKADEPIFHPYPDRFRQGLMDAARNSGFVCVNEIFKGASDAKMEPVSALNPMLSLTEDSRSHVLYVGSVPFGRLPVFVLTDIKIPEQVEQDAQIARRFIFYRLPTSNNWQDNIVAKGIRPHEFRLLSYEHNSAADSILSEVIDEFFQEPIPLYQIAERLQGGQSDSSAIVERDRTQERMRQLYDLVCNAPAMTDKNPFGYTATQGWKLIDRSKSSELIDVWNDLCDGIEPKMWCQSRSIDSTDWTKILGTEHVVTCEAKAHKSMTHVAIRFRSNDSARKPWWVNGKPLRTV